MQISDLDEQHILALAISSEEDDARIYRGLPHGFGMIFPELQHYRRYGKRRGQPSRSIDYPAPRALWRNNPSDPPRTCGRVLQPSTNVVVDTLSLDQMRFEAADMEKRAERFYLTAAAQTQDAHTRKLW